MENDTQDVDFNNEQEVDVTEETPEQKPQETTEEKPKETPEARLARLERQVKKARKDAGIEDEKPEKKAKSGLDRLDKAVLRVEKISDPDEIQLVEDIMKESGKDLEGVLASKYFQNELKEMRSDKESKNAIPSGTKRSGQASKDEVDYWIQKGTLPEDRELRTKVVNAKIAKAKNTKMFTDTPVA